MSDEQNDKKTKKEIQTDIRNRYTILVVLFFVPVLIILYNVAKIQLYEGKAWNKEAFKDRLENREVQANRGNILSHDGQLMASTVPSYTLLMDFKTVDPDTLEVYMIPLCSKLSEKLGDKSAYEYQKHLMKGLHKQSTAWVISHKKVSYLDLKEIEKFPLFCKGQYKSGMYVRKYLNRKKPFGSLASRTIGDIYGDFSKGGKNGLELRYDSLLRGTSGRSVLRKVAGKYMDVVEVNPVDGTDLITTIDVGMQDIVEAALRKELDRVKASSGTVVLMEVETGEVRAICNLGQTISGDYAETKNYAVSDLSEPGSTFKVFSMMVGLEDGYIHPNDPVDAANGDVVMYSQHMRDHNNNRGGYGMIDAKKSIWFSSNIGVSKLIDRYYHRQPMKFINGLKRLGFDQKLDLEIPGSATPKIPYPGCSFYYWSAGSLAWMSIGYVATVPPIYTLAIYNAIANNGKLVRPHFVKGFSRDGVMLQQVETKVLRDKICSDETLRQIRLMLDSVVGSGTGAIIRNEVVSIAGKTGTAQLNYGKTGGLSHQVSFCGYFPADKPKYSAIVVIRDPKGEQASGGRQAGGVFREVAERIYSRMLRLNPGDKLANSEKRDTLSGHIAKYKYPIVKNGNSRMLTESLKELNVRFDQAAVLNAEWVENASESDGIHMQARDVAGKLVPNVRGMGARDAVYLLGKLGLDVIITGKGRVIGQTIAPGTYVERGQRITLTLEL
jgi:cell division protein FtsI (penicillin-binding protein 3)